MSAAPLVGVLALQGDVREHVNALTAAGARSGAVRTLADLGSVDALVIPGGESTTMSKLAIIDGFLEPLRDARRAGMPMYGSCAGMIMLADELIDARPDQETIGGFDMTVRRNAFGRQVDSFEADVDIAGLAGGPFRAVFIRAPWVDRVGPEVEVLSTIEPAGTSRVGATIVAVRQDRLLATAFHPELTGDHRIHESFVEMVRQYA